MPKYSGGCACGAVHYEISAEPMMTGHCQCDKCRHLSGSGHSDLMFFAKDAVKIKGKMSKWSYTADSGKQATRSFCTTCGSHICGTGKGAPTMIGITAGSLDDPSVYKPQIVVFAKTDRAWDLIAADLPRFPGMPPM